MAVINGNGTVTTVGEGVCTISAVLAQNNAITCQHTITVSNKSEETLQWVQSIDGIAQYQNAVFECRHAVNGELTNDIVTYSVKTETGDRNAAAWEINGNEITITGYMPDTVTITARFGGLTSTKTVKISGY